MLFSFLNDPFVEAIAKRCRAVSARQPGPCHAIAATLSLPTDALQRFLNLGERRIDTQSKHFFSLPMLREGSIGKGKQ